MKGTRSLILPCCEWKDRPCGLHRESQRADDCFEVQPPAPSCPALESQSERSATAPGREGTLDLRLHPPKPDAVPQGCPEETLFPRRAMHSVESF